MIEEKVPPTEETFNWIKKVTEEFYELVYKDAWFGKMFTEVKQEVITNQQTEFMIQSFGGPKNFCGRSPKDAHPHVWVNEEIWQYREDLLIQAFRNVGAPDNILKKWLKIDEAFKAGIMNKGGPEECFGRYKTEKVLYFPMPDYLKKKAS